MRSARKSHNEYPVLTKPCLEIFRYGFRIFKDVFKRDLAGIKAFIISDAHIPVVPINNSKVFFKLHILIFVGKDIIIGTGTAGHK